MKKLIKLILSFLILIIGITFTNVNINARSTKSHITSKIHRQIHHMSWSQKVGQMIICRTNNRNATQVGQQIHRYHLGGIVLYGDLHQNHAGNFIHRIQKINHHSVLMGTDQEGGFVSRLGINPKEYPSPQEAYHHNGLTGVLQAYQYSTSQLHQMGVNWNFAPDVDISNPKGLMYSRTFGFGANQTALYAYKVVHTIQKGHVAATLKHFPGYGSVTKNSDTQEAHSNQTLTSLTHNDFLPFKAGIKAGADSIMINNVIYDNIQPNTPATMSMRIIKILRHHLHFHGVIVTDSLDTKPAIQYSGEKSHSIYYLAVKAGNDMIMTSRYKPAIRKLVYAIKTHKISKHRINKSVFRILLMKHKLGLKY